MTGYLRVQLRTPEKMAGAMLNLAALSTQDSDGFTRMFEPPSLPESELKDVEREDRGAPSNAVGNNAP
jgi:hypothetical protein